jgi:hypothetical protein
LLCLEELSITRSSTAAIGRTTDSGKEGALAGVVMAGVVAIEMCLLGGMQDRGIAYRQRACTPRRGVAHRQCLRGRGRGVSVPIVCSADALKEDRLLAGHHLIGFHVAFEDSAYARTLQWNFKEFRIRQIARQCSTPFARPTATPDRGAPRQRALAAYQIGTEAQYLFPLRWFRCRVAWQ